MVYSGWQTAGALVYGRRVVLAWDAGPHREAEDAAMRRPPPSASMHVALRASQATRPLTRAGSPCRSCSRGAGCGCCSSFGSAFLAFAPFRLFPLPGFNVVSDSLADAVRLHPQLLDAPEGAYPGFLDT